MNWSLDWPDTDRIALPLFVAPDKVYFSTNPDRGAVLVRVNHDNDGKAVVEEVWRNRTMRNHVSSSIIWENHIYGFDNATLKCLSVATGEQRWVKRGFGKGSLIAADGLLIILSDRGKLALAEATPQGYRGRGSHQALGGKCWTEPVLAAGRLYLRNQRMMVCYDLRGPAVEPQESEQ